MTLKTGLFSILFLCSSLHLFAQKDLKRQGVWGANFRFTIAPGKGVLVTRVRPGSDAEKARLKENDIIVKANDILLSDPIVYSKAFRSFRAGDKINL